MQATPFDSTYTTALIITSYLRFPTFSHHHVTGGLLYCINAAPLIISQCRSRTRRQLECNDHWPRSFPDADSLCAGLQINRENADGETVEHFLEDALYKVIRSSSIPPRRCCLHIIVLFRLSSTPGTIAYYRKLRAWHCVIASPSSLLSSILRESRIRIGIINQLLAH